MTREVYWVTLFIFMILRCILDIKLRVLMASGGGSVKTFLSLDFSQHKRLILPVLMWQHIFHSAAYDYKYDLY